MTRNYGETATEKADELLFHLALATVSIVLLITFAIGWREGVVVLVIIPTTILLTLFASWLMGYTINRVSLFALIFSIGILVDDAIVVVENIVRHWSHARRARPGRNRDRGGGRSRQSDHRRDADHRRGAAADDVRQRHDGPLHEPDPGQRLDGDAVLVLRRRDDHALAAAEGLRAPFRARGAAVAHAGHEEPARWAASTRASRAPLLHGRTRSKVFLLVDRRRHAARLALFATKTVRVKLLPFDNKSEIQVVLDLPRGSSLEETDRVLTAAAARLLDLPELVSDPVLCRHRGALQFQWPRPPLLLPRKAPSRATSPSI